MQFESDLKKYKDLPFQTRRIQRSHALSLKQQQLPPSPFKMQSPRDSSPIVLSQPSVSDCNSNFIAFSGSTPTSNENVRVYVRWRRSVGDQRVDLDFYSLLFGPLLSTYAQLFDELIVLYKRKPEYKEKELTEHFMTCLKRAWESSASQNLCRAPVPCLTIVQRFVSYLKNPRPHPRDFPFSPYPM